MQNLDSNLKLFAVIGNPIKHSLSPLIHNAAITHYALNAYYGKILLPSNIDSKFLREFVFSSNICGLNITLPFKEVVINALDSIDTLAAKIGAVNTLVRHNDTLMGYNTDAYGFYKCIEDFMESNFMESKRARNVLLLGAGGSAKSIAVILANHNINFCIANRSAAKLAYFKDFGECITFDKIDSKWVENNAFDIIVNATSSSIQGILPLDSVILESLFKNAHLAFDLMYQKQGLTPFCELAKSCNVPTLDGKNMLVYQAAYSFIYFHSNYANISSDNIINIISVMNGALGI